MQPGGDGEFKICWIWLSCRRPILIATTWKDISKYHFHISFVFFLFAHLIRLCFCIGLGCRLLKKNMPIDAIDKKKRNNPHRWNSYRFFSFDLKTNKCYSELLKRIKRIATNDHIDFYDPLLHGTLVHISCWWYWHRWPQTQTNSHKVELLVAYDSHTMCESDGIL